MDYITLATKNEEQNRNGNSKKLKIQKIWPDKALNSSLDLFNRSGCYRKNTNRASSEEIKY